MSADSNSDNATAQSKLSNKVGRSMTQFTSFQTYCLTRPFFFLLTI